MEYIILVMFGMVIGSFLNVCICRIPKEESISYPPSHCTNCNHRLMPLDMIPIFSFVFLGRKCRYCKEKISFQYLLIFSKYGISIAALKYCIFTSILSVISVIDYKTQYIYRSTTIFGAICGFLFLVVQFIVYKNGAFDSIIGGIVGFLIIKIIVVITKGMGDGDAEIAAVCGLFLGIKGILIGLFLGIIIGGIIGIAVIILRLKKLKDKIAFAPFIAIGAFISMMWANGILEWYMKLFL